MIPWVFKGNNITSVPEGVKAFVYLLEIKYKRKTYRYIGYKNFYSITRKRTAGKTRRTVVTKESNWKTYLSSSEHVKTMLKDGGVLSKREIIHMCRTKGEAMYLELKEQVLRDVLCDDTYLNRWINVKIARCYKEEE